MRLILTTVIATLLAAAPGAGDAQPSHFQTLATSKMKKPPARPQSALAGIGIFPEKPLSPEEKAALKAKAEAGDIQAMHDLARRALRADGPMYYWGRWDHPEESARWWRKAAALGDVKAMILLGHLYAEPWGVSQDLDEATRWFRRAADAGSLEGTQDLAGLYLGNWSDVRDDAQANIWIRRLADGGDVESMLLMGVRYDVGWGVANDDAEAQRWYQKVLDATDGETQEWAARAVAFANLGVMYQEGRGGLPHDDAKAAEFYRRAMGWQQRAEYDLALLCESGRGMPRDPEGAAWLYRDLALMSRFDLQTLAKDGIQRLGHTFPTSASEFETEAGALLAHNKLPAPERGCLAGPAGASMSKTAWPQPLRAGVPLAVEGIHYRDPQTGERYEVEFDGRHIDAFGADGKLLWRRNPFVDGKLEPYRVARPTIVWIGETSFKPVKGAAAHRYLGVSFSSSQFGAMDLDTGQFTFMGQE